MRSGLFIFYFLFSFAFAFAQNWQQVPDFPGLARDNGVSFVIADKAYCLTGMQINGTCAADGAVLDGGTETWAPMAGLPAGNEREYVTAFSYNGFGYLFGGLDCNSVCLTDMWRYDPQLDAWQAMSPIPSAGRMGCSCFVLNGKAYLVGGRNTSLTILDEVWEYDIANDNWLQKNNLPFPGTWRGNGFAIDTIGYTCYGIMNTLSFPHAIYQYNRQADSWSPLSNLFLPGRTYAECAVVGQQAYMYGGVDSAGGAPMNDLVVFDPQAQTLSSYVGLPAVPRRSGIAFSLNNGFYLTTGIDSGFTRLKETWKAGNLNGIADWRESEGIRIYPNPTRNVLYLGKECDIRVFNMVGVEIIRLVKVKSVNVENMVPGTYFLETTTSNGISHTAFLVIH